MNDYIKREDAIERLSYHADFYQNDREFGGEEMLYKDSALNEISELPSADVVERSSYESMEHTVAKLNKALSNSVEVVRCKDCVYREVKGEGMTHWFGCKIMEHNDDDWYCSFGERA